MAIVLGIRESVSIERLVGTPYLGEGETEKRGDMIMAFSSYGARQTNDHLVYPNLASASICAASPSVGKTSQLKQPPSGASILGKVTQLPAYSRPSLERYKFEVERGVLEKNS